jgi:hypothetical protein
VPEYLYVGTEPRHFPTLGLTLAPDLDDEGQPTGEPVPFETHQPVVSDLVLNADGSPTTVDADGNPISAPNNAADVMGDPEVADAASERNLEDLDKTELYEIAQEIDLHGRSNMTREELAAAIRDATDQPTEPTEPVAGEGDDTSTEE